MSNPFIELLSFCYLFIFKFIWQTFSFTTCCLQSSREHQIFKILTSHVKKPTDKFLYSHNCPFNIRVWLCSGEVSSSPTTFFCQDLNIFWKILFVIYKLQPFLAIYRLTKSLIGRPENFSIENLAKHLFHQKFCHIRFF